MYKHITLFSLVILILISSNVFAQDELSALKLKDSQRDTKTYIVKSLEVKNWKIRIIPDYVNNILKISCLKDTITIDDYWGVPAKIRVLNKHFLEIKYAVRGGSDVGIDNIMYLCISKNRLYQAFHVLNHTTGFAAGYEAEYTIKATLTGYSKKTFKLIATITDKVISQENPEHNFKYKNQTILNFDTRKNVFYSVKTSLADIVLNSDYADTTSKNRKQQVKWGCFPEVILGKENYYFINGEWYQLEQPKNLYKFR